MNCIAAVDDNWAIGRSGRLIYKIPRDMERFKRLTMGGVVVMGRKTFDSLPNGPLDGRLNIVLSRTVRRSDCVCCADMDELFGALRGFDSDKVFVIGGEQVYRQLLPFCNRAYITRVSGDGGGNEFFSRLDIDAAWRLESCDPPERWGDITYSFCEYRNDNLRYHK